MDNSRWLDEDDVVVDGWNWSVKLGGDASQSRTKEAQFCRHLTAVACWHTRH